MKSSNNKPATWFWIIAILELLWNLGGIVSFVLHITISEEILRAMPEQERQLYTNFPLWVTVTYFIAVFGGTIGNIILLLRKKAATPVLIISFIAIVLQMIYTVFISKAVAVHGLQSLGVPTLVTLFGILLIWLSQTATKRGWLSS